MFRSSVALKVSIVVLLTLPLTVASLNAQSARPADDADVQGAIRLFSAWMDGQIRWRDLPGVAVGVVAGEELVWSQGFGFADIATEMRMTRDTKFRMASHSKLFTAIAIMQLREQGTIQLEDPVSKYLPWFEVRPAAPDDPAITVEHLLTHGSGLQREAGPHWTTRDFPTREELRELMPERQAAFSPEVRFKYSNLAFSIAGLVIEAVSGLTWAEYLQANIFDPLGMSSSSVDVDVEGLATGYTMRRPDGSRETIGFVDARGMGAATGLTSTVADMAKFVSAQFRRGPRGGDRILSTGSLREMHRVRFMENDWASGRGVAFSVQRIDDNLYVGHGGGYPGYTTNTKIQLDSKVGVIVLTNTNDSNPSQIAEQLMNTVGSAVAEATKAEPDEVAWDPSWARFAGLYRRPGRGGETQVVLLNERLVLMSPSARTIGNPIRLEPLGGGVFRYTAPRGGSVIGEEVRFLEENGEVIRMFMGDSYTDRVRE
ncbi:MAG TPA: serine hydrolase domain-containing protein [Acidobacteriota bacterium]|nr:serine hydrolase domain-containing protein [Acidobacteriota bacterium]